MTNATQAKHGQKIFVYNVKPSYIDSLRVYNKIIPINEAKTKLEDQFAVFRRTPVRLL